MLLIRSLLFFSMQFFFLLMFTAGVEASCQNVLTISKKMSTGNEEVGLVTKLNGDWVVTSNSSRILDFNEKGLIGIGVIKANKILKFINNGFCDYEKTYTRKISEEPYHSTVYKINGSVVHRNSLKFELLDRFFSLIAKEKVFCVECSTVYLAKKHTKKIAKEIFIKNNKVIKSKKIKIEKKDRLFSNEHGQHYL